MLYFILLSLSLIAHSSLDTTCGSGKDKLMLMIGFQSIANDEGEFDDVAVRSLFAHSDSKSGMKAKMCERGWGVNVIHGDRKTAAQDKQVTDPVGYVYSQLEALKALPCTQRPKQLLINVLAHGNSLDDERAWERNEPHLVIVGRDAAGNAIRLNMSELAKKLRPINSACPFPKVAIMDMSCGSAETLVNFAHEGLKNTCIMTGAPTNGYASVRSTNKLNAMIGSIDEFEKISGNKPTIHQLYKGLVQGGTLTDMPKISGCTERMFDDTTEKKWLNTSECQFVKLSQNTFYEKNKTAKVQRNYHYSKNLKNFDAVARYYYREKAIDCIATGGCSRAHLREVDAQAVDRFTKECPRLEGKAQLKCKLEASSKVLTAAKASLDQTEKILQKLNDQQLLKAKTINDLQPANLSPAEMDYVKELCFVSGADKCDGVKQTVAQALMLEENQNLEVLEGAIQRARVARLNECLADGNEATKACADFAL
jgi:hypothetical protein